MRTPDEPGNETARLRSLQDLKILDTQPEERFDRITRLASRIFDVPIALVSLVDRDRQWFKSKHGLEAEQTPRDVSFCGHAILGQEGLVVEDTHADGRFRDNPLVTADPAIRFYAGVPVHSAEGHAVGTLCVIDREAKKFSEDQHAILRELASMVDQELVLLNQATTDELTRISNRRGFLKIGEHVLALCRRKSEPASLIEFDLNGFKQINDQLGHDAGDGVLREFARCLIKYFRDSDVIARLGGDEFCVLASGSTIEQAKAAELRFREEFRHSRLHGEYPTLSWGAGFAQFDCEADDSLKALMGRADEAMYVDKRAVRR